MPNLSSFNIELSKNHAFLHNDRSLIKWQAFLVQLLMIV